MYPTSCPLTAGIDSTSWPDPEFNQASIENGWIDLKIRSFNCNCLSRLRAISLSSGEVRWVLTINSWDSCFQTFLLKLHNRAEQRSQKKNYSQPRESSETLGGEHVPKLMGGDIHNISVLTANLFLSCRDSHSDSCQKAIKWNRLFSVFHVYKPNQAGEWHSSAGSGLWGGMLPRNKGPSLAGAHMTEQWEHLHRSGSTFKLMQVKKSICSSRLQSRSDVETQMVIVLGSGVNHTN